MFETSSTLLLIVDQHYSSCDCNDKSYFLRVNLPNMVSIFWSMSLPGLEEGGMMSFYVSSREGMISGHCGLRRRRIAAGRRIAADSQNADCYFSEGMRPKS